MRHSLPATSRRQVLLASATMAATSAFIGGGTFLGLPTSAAAMPAAVSPLTITTKDGVELFVKSWGTGPAVVFSHGWPLSADFWDGQMHALAEAGYRVIAHDRRSHGRSEQVWSGNHLDRHADDLADVLDSLDVRGATLIGHSTGVGEVARYIGRHGVSRVQKTVLISAHSHTSRTVIAAPARVLDGLRENRSQYYDDLATQYFSYNRPGAAVPVGTREEFWRQAMMGGSKGSTTASARLCKTT